MEKSILKVIYLEKLSVIFNRVVVGVMPTNAEMPRVASLLHLHSNKADQQAKRLVIGMVGLPGRGKTYTGESVDDVKHAFVFCASLTISSKHR